MIAEDRDGQLIIRSFALKGMRDLLVMAKIKTVRNTPGGNRS